MKEYLGLWIVNWIGIGCVIWLLGLLTYIVIKN